MRAILLLGIIAAAFVGDAAARTDAVLLAQSGARGMSFDIYIRLQNGMSEGELVLRAGKPDSEAVENFHNDIVKTYYYFPTSSDPWITTIKLRGGRIVEMERIKKF
jgi:hypothetical protein